MLKSKFLNKIIILFITTLISLSYFKIGEKIIQGNIMGTYYVIKYVNKSFLPYLERVLRNDISNLLEEIDHQMSTYHLNSELSKFNKFQKINTRFPISLPMMTVIKEALYINRLTNGAFDITIGPLVNLWGFGSEGSIIKHPSENMLNLYRQWIGTNKLIIDDNCLIKKIPQLYIDLSAIAKGYGVDIIAKYLELQNIHNYMVNIGGEIRTKGRNNRNIVWRIAIERPSYEGLVKLPQEIIKLDNMSVATSGNYRNYFQKNGIYYSHIINPKTGQPVVHNLILISVIAPSCIMADGLSTGLNVLGPDAAMELAEHLNLPVFMVVVTSNGFESHYSSAFEPYLMR